MKRLFLILSFAALFAAIPAGSLAVSTPHFAATSVNTVHVIEKQVTLNQSDAGFLEDFPPHYWPQDVHGWYCKHMDGSFWTWTPMDNYADAVAWCEENNYRW